jgi:hypothetical protein
MKSNIKSDIKYDCDLATEFKIKFENIFSSFRILGEKDSNRSF